MAIFIKVIFLWERILLCITTQFKEDSRIDHPSTLRIGYSHMDIYAVLKGSIEIAKSIR